MTRNAVDPIKLNKGNSLKNLTIAQKGEFIKYLASEVATAADCEMSILNEEYFNICLLVGDAELANNKINQLTISCLNGFIENSLGENPKEYNRNLILFESERTDETLTIRWAK